MLILCILNATSRVGRLNKGQIIYFLPLGVQYVNKVQIYSNCNNQSLNLKKKRCDIRTVIMCLLFVLFSRVKIVSCCGNPVVTHLSFIRWDQSRRRLKERQCLLFISLTLLNATFGLCALQWTTDRRCVCMCVCACICLYIACFFQQELCKELVTFLVELLSQIMYLGAVILMMVSLTITESVSE